MASEKPAKVDGKYGDINVATGGDADRMDIISPTLAMDGTTMDGASDSEKAAVDVVVRECISSSTWGALSLLSL